MTEFVDDIISILNKRPRGEHLAEMLVARALVGAWGRMLVSGPTPHFQGAMARIEQRDKVRCCRGHARRRM